MADQLRVLVPLKAVWWDQIDRKMFLTLKVCLRKHSCARLQKHAWRIPMSLARNSPSRSVRGETKDERSPLYVTKRHFVSRHTGRLSVKGEELFLFDRNLALMWNIFFLLSNITKTTKSKPAIQKASNDIKRQLFLNLKYVVFQQKFFSFFAVQFIQTIPKVLAKAHSFKN